MEARLERAIEHLARTSAEAMTGWATGSTA
jgi:hypothetical protein